MTVTMSNIEFQSNVVYYHVSHGRSQSQLPVKSAVRELLQTIIDSAILT